METIYEKGSVKISTETYEFEDGGEKKSVRKIWLLVDEAKGGWTKNNKNQNRIVERSYVPVMLSEENFIDLIKLFDKVKDIDLREIYVA